MSDTGKSTSQRRRHTAFGPLLQRALITQSPGPPQFVRLAVARVRFMTRCDASVIKTGSIRFSTYLERRAYL